MNYNLYVTKDVVVGESMTQINFYRNDAEAKRAWGNAIKALSKNNPDNSPIKDLQLYKIGEFNTSSLEIKPCSEYIAAGAEFIS